MGRRRIWGLAMAGVIGLGCLGLQVSAGSEATEPGATPGAGAQATYVGGKKCKKCHIKQNKTWKKTKHATTWDLLAEEYRNDEATDEGGKKCVSCHMTGYGMPGGPENMQAGLDTGLEGTQCEGCHGPGSNHIELANEHKDADPIPDVVKQAINRVPQNTCVGCHNPHVSHEQYKKE